MAREQNDGALRQHIQKGVCAMYQAVMSCERRRSLVTRNPVAETVDNVRKHQELTETSPIQLVLTSGYYHVLFHPHLYFHLYFHLFFFLFFQSSSGQYVSRTIHQEKNWDHRVGG